MSFSRVYYELLESPFNIGDLTKSKSRLNSLEITLKHLKHLKLKKYNLFSSMKYSINENYFIVYKNNEIIMYILYTQNNKVMNIKNIEKIDGPKNMQFKVLSFILENNIRNIIEIETGNALSKANIKAHIKFLKNNNFNLFIRIKNKLHIIETEEDIKCNLKDFDSIFVLMKSSKNKILQEMYKSNFSDAYDDLEFNKTLI